MTKDVRWEYCDPLVSNEGNNFECASADPTTCQFQQHEEGDVFPKVDTIAMGDDGTTLVFTG
jgi:hypothetical protein